MVAEIPPALNLARAPPDVMAAVSASLMRSFIIGVNLARRKTTEYEANGKCDQNTHERLLFYLFTHGLGDPLALRRKVLVKPAGFGRQLVRDFSRADRVVVNTREFAAALRVAEPQLDVLCIPNGIDLEGMPPRDISAVEEGSVAHVGTLYAGRNLSSVCAAMRELLVDYPEAAATLRLNVAGPMADAHQTQMEEDIAAVGLQSVVILHGMLPRPRALALLSRSHLALVLAQNQPMQIPAKLYECVGLGIPTLVIAEATSAAASEARRIGAMTLDGSDVAGIRALLEDVVARRIPTAVTSSAPISYHDLANQMDRVLREPAKRREALLIEELAGSAVRTQ